MLLGRGQKAQQTHTRPAPGRRCRHKKAASSRAAKRRRIAENSMSSIIRCAQCPSAVPPSVRWVFAPARRLLGNHCALRHFQRTNPCGYNGFVQPDSLQGKRNSGTRNPTCGDKSTPFCSYRWYRYHLFPLTSSLSPRQLHLKPRRRFHSKSPSRPRQPRPFPIPWRSLPAGSCRTPPKSREARRHGCHPRL